LSENDFNHVYYPEYDEGEDEEDLCDYADITCGLNHDCINCSFFHQLAQILEEWEEKEAGEK